MTTTIETPAGPSQPMVLNMGPQHPSTHGVLRVILELDGEIVLKAKPVIGYLHTGIEKSCESKTYSQCITLTDRIDYLAPLSNNLGFCLAAEKLIRIEVPKRAQYIRVLLTELTRITSHLVWLGTHAIDLGAMSVFLYCFREREEILKIYEYVSGQRMMTSYFRIGGLALEPPPGLAGPRAARDRPAAGAHRRIRRPADRRTEFGSARTKGIGMLSAADAIAMGVSGPLLRASGVAYDIRKVFPYSSYDEFDFEVPDANRGRLLRAISGARGGNSREHEDRPPGDGQDSLPGAIPRRGAGNHSAVARGDENRDRRPDLPLQDFHRGFCRAAG